MSEPVARPRYYGESGNAFDVDEIERRMRQSIEPSPSRDADPLAELARLVGQTNDDAFSRIFEGQRGPTSPPPARGEAPRLMEPPPVAASPRDNLYAAAFDPYPEPRREESYSYDDRSYPQAAAQQAYEPAQSNQAYAFPQGASWQGQDYAQGGYDEEPFYAEPPRRTGRARLLVGAAILVVVGGGLTAFMMRGPASVGKEAPTILANAGPTKVAPAEPSSDGAKPSISILERGGSSGSPQSRLVQNEEQPVDVSATARVSGVRPARPPDSGAAVTLAPPAAPPVPNSIFAEPKRVKAVAVRPDGSIVDQPTPQRAQAPVVSSTTPPPVATSRSTDMASLVASTTPGSGQKAAARTVETPKPPVKPAAVASAPPAQTSSAAGAGTGFSVQLVGTTSVEEAKDAVERLTRRFSSELGFYRPSVVKADVGSKTVYRVRVKGMSSDDANMLCAKLKSGGGSCFVARD
jgi:hypothetical protein